MAIFKGKIRQRNSGGTYDYLLPETTIDMVNGLQSELDDKVSEVDLVKVEKKVKGIVNAREYDVIPASEVPVVGNSDSIQEMINQLRQVAIESNLEILPTIQLQGGRYIIDKEIKMSPYLAFESLGKVIFDVQHNGTAIWIAPSEDDPSFPDTAGTPTRLRKQDWNRGNYFIGNKKGFTFTSTTIPLNDQNLITHLELGSRNSSDTRNNPVSRYTIEQVSFYNANIAIKLNTTNNYIGTFKDIHSELNNHHVVWGDLNGTQLNSGENFNFINGLYAGARREGFVFNVGGIDITFTNISFDFNSDKVFYIRDSGVYVRINMGYTEKISGNQRFLVIDPKSENSAFGRSGLYLNNHEMLLTSPNKLIDNIPHSPSNRRTNLSVFINGLELRYEEIKATPINNIQLLNQSDNIYVFGTGLIFQHDQQSIITKDNNLCYNYDFSKSTVGTNLASGTDPYWTSVSTNTSVSVGTSGESGSNSLNFTITNTTTNSSRISSKFKYNVSPGQLVTIFPSVKIQSAKNTTQILSRIICYNELDEVVTTLNFTGFLTTSTTHETFDGYFYPRLLSRFRIPSGTVKILPSFAIANAEYNYSVNDVQVLISG